MPYTPVPLHVQASAANQTGTSSTSLVMLGAGQQITPNSTGRVLVLISGDAVNNTANGGGKAAIAFGTGSVPSNGAAATGTIIGSTQNIHFGETATATVKTQFCLQAVVTGLTLGTAAWFDLQFAAVTTGTCTLQNYNTTLIEL